MQFITLIEFGILAFIVIYVIQHFSQKDVPLHVKCSAFITWMISIGMVLFIPYDLYLLGQSNKLNIQLDEYEPHINLSHIYKIFYYLLFFLCWVIIPIQQGCIDSGYHKFEDRLKYSLKINLIFYTGIAFLGLLFLILVIKLNLPGEHGIMNFFYSLANCWGIFLIMVLLGYSLVTIPKAHWRTTNLQQQMKYLEFQTYIVIEEQEQCLKDFLQMIIQTLHIIEKSQNSPDQSYIDIYTSKALDLVPPEFLQNCKDLFYTEEYQRNLDPELQYTKEDAVNNYLYVKYKYESVRRTRCEWKILKKKAFLQEDIIQNYNNPQKQIISNIRDPIYTDSKYDIKKNHLNWLYYTRLKPKMKYFYAIFLTLLSILLIIDETSIFFMNFKYFALFGMFLRFIVQFELNVFMIQLVLLLPLSYIIYNVVYGFFRLRIKGFYGVYPNKNTDSSSLLFTSINISRISAPLCFNFLNILNVKQSAFHRAIGNINLVPVLGEQFSQYFPLVLIFLVIFNYFDLYDKLVKKLGIKSIQFAPNFDEQYVQQGKEILRKKREWELLEIQRKKQNNPCIRQSYFLQNQDRTSVYMQLLESKDSMV